MISNSKRIQMALEIVLRKHHEQVRKLCDTPYSIHPISAAMMLLEMDEKEDVIIGALLHDTIEDTDTTYEEIEEMFGTSVCLIVRGCSEQDKTLSWEERKNHTIHGIPELSRDTQVVVIADKIHNLSSINMHLGDENIWKSFKRGYESQKWYYESLRTSFNQSEHLKNSKLLSIYNELYLKVFN